MARTIKQIAADLGELVTEKNEAYGNSFVTTGEVLKILYPNGVGIDGYTDLLLVVRILDKISRIANGKSTFGESEFKDIAGYGICGILKDEH